MFWCVCFNAMFFSCQCNFFLKKGFFVHQQVFPHEGACCTLKILCYVFTNVCGVFAIKCVHKDVCGVFVIMCAICEKCMNMCLQKKLRAQHAVHPIYVCKRVCVLNRLQTQYVFAKDFACSTGRTPIVV